MTARRPPGFASRTNGNDRMNEQDEQVAHPGNSINTSESCRIQAKLAIRHGQGVNAKLGSGRSHTFGILLSQLDKEQDVGSAGNFTHQNACDFPQAFWATSTSRSCGWLDLLGLPSSRKRS